MRGGGLWGCAWRCGSTYCAATRVGRWHACTHMHTSGVAVQIICATIHTHVVILPCLPKVTRPTNHLRMHLLSPLPHTLTQLKGFREKNTDLMRQDIVNVLKTSKQNLVRALIGLPSVAAAQWGRVRTLLLATAIFREAGRLRRQQSTKGNSLTRLKTGTLNGGRVRLAGRIRLGGGWVGQDALCIIGRHDVYS